MNAEQRRIYETCTARHAELLAENDSYGKAYRQGYLIGGKPPRSRTLVYAAYRAGVDRHLAEDKNRRENKPMDAIDEFHAYQMEQRFANAMRVGVLTGGVKAAIGTLTAARASRSAARELLIDDAITGLQRALDTSEGE